MSILVKDGVLQLDEMKAAGISKQNLFSELRGKKIFHLGKVKRVYFEACGLMNVYTQTENKPGLPVLPEGETEVITRQAEVVGDQIACTNCGSMYKAANHDFSCGNCGAKAWTNPIK
jgi:uncharacterized membrane protein YcaP (DUF421 family)